VTVRLADEPRVVSAGTNLRWTINGPLGSAPVLTKDSSFNFGETADWDSRQPFSLGAWVFVPSGFKGEGWVARKISIAAGSCS
jgi:hypothetical protein